MLITRGELVERTHNIFLLVFLFLFLGPFASTKLLGQVQLSPQAQIGVLTCEPGPFIYSTFGHTCFHVFDPTTGLNEVYNYGTFDFETPGFVRKFVQGKLNYILSVEDYQRFRYFYLYNKRSVYEQGLLLSLPERQRFYEYLYTNALPENRMYLYDYFFKNCSSVPRDILFEQLGDSLQVDSSLFQPGNLTFRELIHEKLTRLPWMKFGIDLILGMKIDRKATPYEAMFLPDQLMAHLKKQNRILQQRAIPLVIFEGQPVYGEELPPYSGIRPSHITWTVFLLIVLYTAWQFRQNSTRRWLDCILFLIGGLAGIVMIVMWLGTDHSTTSHNLNLLWALPTHLVAAVALMRKHLPSWLGTYFLIAAILHGLFILFHPLLPQVFPFAILPIVGSLFLRSIFLWRKQS
ncbi:MAG: DUF4105 domain-containing protein [Bacteroidota bacterium]